MTQPQLDSSRNAGTDFHRLQGRVVLVTSTQDHRNPPTGLRGWIDVHEQPGEPAQVAVAVEFPQMFTSRAHHRTFSLDREALARLLASERNGTFEFTIDDELR